MKHDIMIWWKRKKEIKRENENEESKCEGVINWEHHFYDPKTDIISASNVPIVKLRIHFSLNEK